MNASNPTIHCLLCTATLTEQNKTKEHAIPRAIGGRIESDRITCRACNNATSSKIDKYLGKAYFPVVGALSEFLPADNDVIGNGAGTAIFCAGGAEIKIKKMPLDPKRSAKRIYVGEDPGGHKVVVPMSSADAESARASAHAIGQSKYGEGYRIEPVAPGPPPALEMYNVHLPGSIGVQCGALKAGILTLAALDAETHGIDLRSPMFDAVRQTIKAVNDTPATDRAQVPAMPNARLGVCLGLHQDLLPQLTRLRRLSNFPSTDFEHFILLSGNAATQTLELFVVLFAAHVFVFRLTNEWLNGDIVLLAVNGILKNSGYSHLERLRVNPLPAHARNAPKSGPDPAHSLKLQAQAKAYQFRHSKQVRETIRDGVRLFGTLKKAVLKMIEGLYQHEAENELIRNKCAKFAAEATGTGGSAPTDDQIDQAANDIAQLIDDMAGRGIFPSRYD